MLNFHSSPENARGIFLFLSFFIWNLIDIAISGFILAFRMAEANLGQKKAESFFLMLGRVLSRQDRYEESTKELVVARSIFVG